MASLKDLIVMGPARFLDKLYGNLEGNATSADKLKTARSINGTNFDGTAAITTNNWGTARTISISSAAGNTGTSINGSENKSLIIPSTMNGFTSITSSTFVGKLTGNSDTTSALKGSTSASVPLTQNSAGYITYSYNINKDTTGNMPHNNNANGVLTINTHSGEYQHQLGFSSDGNIYYRSTNGSALTSSLTWRKILNSSNYSSVLDSIYINTTGDTMTGALNFKNGTWNKVGDDAQFGDNNTAGSFAIQGLNGTTNLKLVKYNDENSYATISWDGTYVTSSAHLVLSTSRHLYMTYNGSVLPVLYTHNNGNVSLRALGSGLYIAYEQTTGIYFGANGGWGNWTSDLLNIKNNLYVEGKGRFQTATNSYALNTSSFICDSWIRTKGKTGWYNEDYGGGWYMEDSTFIKSYNSKAVRINNNLYIGTTAGAGTGLALYGDTAATTYGIHFSTTGNYGKHGDVQSDWATYLSMNAVGQRGWIYRAGSTNVASISANGIGTFKGIMGEVGHIVSPDGGKYTTTATTLTGYLKITLPVSWTNCMLRFIVDIYDYSSGGTVTYTIGGYNYSPTPAWHCISAHCTAPWGQTKSNLTVRFGHDGSKCAIYIGESNTSWNYPQVIIRDVLIGYGAASDIATYSKGWSIGFTTTLGSYISTLSNTNTGYSVNYASSAGSATSANGLKSVGNLTSSTVDSFLEADTVKWAKADNSAVGSNDGLVVSFGWSASYGAQLWLDDGSGEGGMKLRNRGSGGSIWNPWRQVLTENNYTGYADNRYVKLAGSTLNAGAQIIRAGAGTSWIYGRDKAIIRMNSISGWDAAISVKTNNGSWDIGVYDASSYADKLVFSYTTDTNYNSGNNTSSVYTIDANGYFNGTCSYASSAGSVAWGNVTGKPSTFAPSTHYHNILTAGGEGSTASVRSADRSSALITGGWGSTSAGYLTQYGTTLDVSGYSTWYHRLAFNTNGIIEYWQGINTTTLSKVGYLYTSQNIIYSSTEPTAPHIGAIWLCPA